MTYFKNEQPSVNQLIGIKKVDITILGKLYEEFSPTLYGLMLRILEDEAMAEETMLDCFDKISKSDTIIADTRKDITSRLVIMARRLALEKVQTKKYRYQLLAKELYKCRIYLNEDTQQDQLPAGNAETNILPETLKAILDKVYFEGMSISAVAVKFGLSDEQVKISLKQAVTALKSLPKVNKD